MGKIRVLDEHIANQIAAGEVVERPASVVKELVENAVDAESSRIDVTVEEGGLQLIRITDNGSGMEPDDCETAFHRHATSKIASGKDLFHIRTLGFRGEALPSIAAVAKVELTTSTTKDGLGRKLRIEGGAVREIGETAASKGTDIAVRELFYNTPARLKYMKTIQTELGHISDYMYRLALARPDIAFTLRHNGNVLLQTLGNGDLLQVIAAVYGSATAKSMVALNADHPDYTVDGFVSKPELTRANRSGLTVIVNGRYIRNYALNNAIQSAYHTLLPINRYPMGVIRIDMDPSLVDVNVHPAKLEVRFSKEGELTSWAEAEIRRTIGRQSLIPQAAKPAPKKDLIREQVALFETAAEAAGQPGGPHIGQPPSEPHTWQSQSEPNNSQYPGEPQAPRRPEEQQTVRRTDGVFPAPPGASGANDTSGTGRSFYAEPAVGMERLSRAADSAELPRQPQPSTGRPASPSARSSAPMAPPPSRPVEWKPDQWAEAFAPRSETQEKAVGLPAFPKLYPIGQMHGTYIIAQNDTGLYLIDQHAAHERINYEYYFEKFGNPAEASQQLLVPITLEFTPSDALALQGRLSVFEQVGVILEPFGGASFLVRACPHWLPAGEEQKVIEEIAEWVLAEKKTVDLMRLREKSAILCSCKASIKANQSLSSLEIEVLLNRLAGCRNPYTCPHGRPIVVSFSTYELEKMFKRVM